MTTIDLGTYRSYELSATAAEAEEFVLHAKSKSAQHDLPISEYRDDVSPAMKAAWKRLAEKLDHPDDQPEEAASSELLTKITDLRDYMRTESDVRYLHGRWQRKYAIHIEELKYLAQFQRSSKERAAILAYADNRLKGAIGADGEVRWNPFNDSGMPTFYFDEDLLVEDTLYYLWTHTEDLMRVFNNNPPALPYPADPIWLAAISNPTKPAEELAS